MAGLQKMDGRKRTAPQRFSITNLMIIVALLMLCSAFLVRSAPASKLEKIHTAGELRVLLRNGPISYYQGAEGATGFEYTLLKGLAEELGVELVIENEERTLDIVQKADDSAFDLASPSVINNALLKERFRFAEPFLELHAQLIFNANQTAPTSLDDLAGKTVMVVNKSSSLLSLQSLQQSLPNIHWELVENVEMTDLMEMVERGTTDYAVVDSAIYNIHRYSFPQAQVAFNLDKPQPLAWAMPASRDNSLYTVVQNYLARIKQSGELAAISAHFFDQYIEVDTNDALMFSQRFENRFPRWEESIKAASSQYNVDWQLVAAVGYQESQWIPNAQSPTGVRGFMMLTPETAKELGVKNLDDPKQSIQGGAKYLRYLLDTLPDSIQGDERLQFALAAYNQGIGHLDDARALTRRMKGDANRWEDVSKVFPLLAKPEYYSKATYGFSRGWEPVIYVRNVLNYQKILAFKEKQEQLRMATSNPADDLEFSSTQQEKSAMEKLNKIRLSSASSLSFL